MRLVFLRRGSPCCPQPEKHWRALVVQPAANTKWTLSTHFRNIIRCAPQACHQPYWPYVFVASCVCCVCALNAIRTYIAFARYSAGGGMSEVVKGTRTRRPEFGQHDRVSAPDWPRLENDMANTSGCENAGNELGHIKRTVLDVAKIICCRIFVLIRTTTTDGWMPRRCTLTSSRTTSSPVSIKVTTALQQICQNAITGPGSKVCTISIQRLNNDSISTQRSNESPSTSWNRYCHSRTPELQDPLPCNRVGA